MRFGWFGLLMIMAWISIGFSARISARELTRQLDSAGVLDLSLFRISRSDAGIRIPAHLVKDWIESHPIYKKRMAEPDSPSKHLFVTLSEKAKSLVNLTKSTGEIPNHFLFVPGKNEDDRFFLALTYSAAALQRAEPKDSEYRIRRQLEAIQTSARALGGTPNASDQTKLIAIHRFNLAAMAFGIEGEAEFLKWAKKFKLEDLLESRDMAPVSERDRKASFSYANNVAHTLNMPTFLDGRMWGLWRHWEYYEYQNTPEAQSATDLIEGSLSFFNRERAFNKKIVSLSDESEAALQYLVRLQLTSPHLSLKDVQARAKVNGKSLAGFSNQDLKKIFQETVEAAAEYTYSIRGRTALESPWLSNKDEPNYFHEGQISSLVLAAIEKSVSTGEVPIFRYDPSSGEQINQQLFEYLSKHFSTYSKQVPLFQNHLSKLFQIAKMKSKTDLDAETENRIAGVYSTLVALSIANLEESPEKSWNDLTEEDQEFLKKIGLSPTKDFDPWTPLTAVSSFLEGDILKSKPEIERLRSNAFELRIFANEVQFAVRLGKIFPTKGGAILREKIPKEFQPYGLNGKREKWTSPALSIGDSSDRGPAMKPIRERMQMLATIFALSRPRNAQEFSMTLRDEKKVGLYLKGAPSFRYSEDLIESLYNDFMDELRSAIVSRSCEDSLRAMAAAAKLPIKP